jgi:hypothetical protein
VLADGGGAGAAGGDAELAEVSGEAFGVHGCPARRPENSHWESGLVAVFMLSRWLIQVSRSCARGVGTGDGGSPRRRSTWSWSWMTSLMVSRATRLRGWA